MKKKSIILIIAMVLMIAVVGCGEESTSSESNTSDTSEMSDALDTSDTDLGDADVVESQDMPQVEEVKEDDADSSISEQSPLSEEELPTENSEEQKYIEIIADDVRIRSSASTDSNDNILGKVKKGKKYIKTGDEGDWSKLDFDGQDGFIKSEFIKEISKEEYEAKQQTVESTQAEDKSVIQTDVAQDNGAALLAQQQQEALLAQQQQAALLAQQQAAAQQAATQQQAAASNSGGGSYENTQLRSDRIVYITPTGKKYHYDKECAGKNAIPKNLDDVSGSYGPCGTCVLQ